MKRTITFFIFCFLISNQLRAQISPWGTGLIFNQTLDTLQGQSVYISHTSDIVNFPFDLNNYLSNYNFNMYIPPSYDGTKPFGLITYISSGTFGGLENSWLQVLDEKQIILISANNIGNSVAVVDRMGVALAGMESLKENLNIDTTRLYTSGQSGGGRSAAGLLFFFPEEFQGMVPNCGSSYLRLVDQDYETYQPNSHYEYGIFQFTQAHLDYVKSFDPICAMMTSYNDFREGDIMNIYHNGMEEDGFKSKILETAGSHCATTTAQFRDAVNFVEHPHLDVIRDSFQGVPIVGTGFKMTDAAVANTQLSFNHNANGQARAYSKDLFFWNNSKGAIFRTSIALDSANYNQNSYFNINFLDFADPTIYHENLGDSLYPALPNILLSIVFDAAQPTVYILAENPSGGISNDTIFVGTFSDWSANDSLAVKYHIWDQELRVEFGSHFTTNVQTNNLATFLDDGRSLQIRTGSSYWAIPDFNKGTLLAFASGKLDTAQSSTTIALNYVEMIAANKVTCNPLNHQGKDSIVTCGAYTWIDNNTYTSSTNGVYAVVQGGAGVGCDSLVELELTIDVALAPDMTVTTNGTDLTSNAVGATYQWLDCNNNNSPIIGETGQTYTATSNGAYAVEVTQNNCVDTSACITVTVVSLTEHSALDAFEVYPNPTNGHFVVDFTKIQERLRYRLRAIDGSVLESQVVEQTQRLDLEIAPASGIYLLELIDNNGNKTVLKIIKQ